MPPVLDKLAQSNPARPYAAMPISSDVEDGYRDIAVSDVARCVDFMAKWIEDRFGRSNTFENIAYIGTQDLRGPILLLSGIKLKWSTVSQQDIPIVNSSKRLGTILLPCYILLGLPLCCVYEYLVSDQW
ncbi:hypothetical protein F5Y15DRAFT_389753 [Xylariaceae sp. FL0016]|nr:hypothetical protein F5Y15DRAFT_389753 [Xylariaceae sp. FL0016]